MVKKKIVILVVLTLFYLNIYSNYVEKLFDNPSISESLKILEEGKEKGDLDTFDYATMYYLYKAQGEREKAILTALEGIDKGDDYQTLIPLLKILDEEMNFNNLISSLTFNRLNEKAEKTSDPLLKATLMRLLSNYYIRKGDKEGLKYAYLKSGIPDGFYFKVITDEHPRLNFYSVNYHKIEKKDLRYVERNGFSLSIPSAFVDAEWDFLSLFEIPFSIENDDSVILSLYIYLPCRLFVDGKEIYKKDGFERLFPPLDLFNLKITKGKHLLSIVFYSPTSDSGLNISIIPTQSKITFLRENLSSLDSEEFTPKKISLYSFADDDFSNLKNFFIAFATSSYNYAKIKLDELLENHKESAIINILNYNFYIDSETFFPEKFSLSMGEKSIDLLKNSNPSTPEVEYFSLFLKAQSSDADEILSGLNGLVENYSKDPRWFIQLVEELDNSGFEEEAEEVLLKSYSTFPSTTSVEDEIIRFYSSKKNFKKALIYLEKISLERAIYSKFESYYDDIGDYNKAIEFLTKRIYLFGNFNFFYENQLYYYLLKMEKYIDALKVVDKMLEEKPDSSDFLLLKAKTLFYLGKSDEALSIYKKIKEIKPSYFSVDYAEWLLGKELPFEKDRISFEEAISNFEDKPDGASSAYILDHQVTEVQRDGSTIERYHGIVKIYDKDGVEKEGEQQFPADYLLCLRTIKKDGSIVEPEYVSYKRTIGMSGLEVGDIIEYEYFTLNDPNGIKKKSYYTPYVFLFQDLEKPFYHTSFTIKMPKDFDMAIYEHNLPSKPLEYEEGEMRVRKYDYNNMTRVAFEPYIPYKTYYLPLVDVAANIDWNDYFLYLKNGFLGSFAISEEIEEMAKKLTSGVKTTLEKVEKITDFVMTEIEGEGERWGDPLETLLMRQGNRFQLTIALLKSINVDFEILLAENPNFKFDKNNLVMEGRFNIPVLKIKGEKPFYIYLEESERDITILPWFLNGAKAISLSKEKFETEVLPYDLTLWKNAILKEKRVIDKDGNLKVEIENILDPDQSSQLRSILKKLEKSRWQEVLQMAFSKEFRNVEVENFEFTNFDDIKKPLFFTTTLSVPSYAEKEGNTLKLSELFGKFELTKTFGGLKERTLPIQISSPIISNITYEIILPKGKITSFYTKRKNIKSQFGDYSLNIKKRGNEIIVNRRLFIFDQIVEPSTYPDFVKFLKQIDESENTNLSLELD